MTATVILLMLFSAVASVIFMRRGRRKADAVRNRVILISGGSEGIGLSVAQQCVYANAALLVLVARSKDKLLKAEKLLAAAAMAKSVSTKIITITCDLGGKDVSISVDHLWQRIEDEVTAAVGDNRGVDVFVSCAGTCVAEEVTRLSDTEIHGMMTLNGIAPILVSKRALAGMYDRGWGRIVFIESQASQVGLIGMSAYSASKFALRGFVEGLVMEAGPRGVSLIECFPPATDTPGFEVEERRKPQITKQIEGTSGLWRAETVASKVVDSINNTVPFTRVTFGPLGASLAYVTAGMGPASSTEEAIISTLTAGPLRFVALILRWNWNRQVHRYLIDQKTSH